MRLCLTGTPLENHLGELWSLMDFSLTEHRYKQILFTKALHGHPTQRPYRCLHGLTPPARIVIALQRNLS
jgi:hypothetical protein